MTVAQNFPSVASCHHQEAQGHVAAEAQAEEEEEGASQAEFRPQEGRGRKSQQVEEHKSSAQRTACQQLKNLHAAKTFGQKGTPSCQALSRGHLLAGAPCSHQAALRGSGSSTAFHRVSESVQRYSHMHSILKTTPRCGQGNHHHLHERTAERNARGSHTVFI